MRINSVFYLISSFLLSLATCLAYVVSEIDLLSDDDYVHNYLGCGPEGDSTAIPMAGVLMVGALFVVFHLVCHILFIVAVVTRKKSERKILMRLGFYKDEKVVGWIVKGLLYLMAVYLIYDYCISFYKFYLFEFGSVVLMVLTALAYSIAVGGFWKKETKTLTQAIS
ncbi:MAG: hypothetical protein M3R17_17590 [Bacteroidota bacterium]|nr:hypothetical protein [Bacteroidota bacterium]